MNWAKVDAVLAGLLDEAGEGDLVPVFVHVIPEALGGDEKVAPLNGDGEVRTGLVTPTQVEALTDQPWVRQVRSSGPLRLLSGADEHHH